MEEELSEAISQRDNVSIKYNVVCEQVCICHFDRCTSYTGRPIGLDIYEFIAICW